MSRRTAGAALLLAIGATAAGCRGDRSEEPPRQFFPSLDDQPKYNSNQSESAFFADGRQSRRPLDGVVAYGRRSAQRYGGSPEQRRRAERRIALERRDLLRDDDRVYRGVNEDGSYVQRVPLRQLFGVPEGEPVPSRLVRGLLETGRERYNIYCIVCHGGLGDGKGMVGVRWSYPLPNFHDPVYQRGAPRGQDGYFFHVIRNGVANEPGREPRLRMPSYAEQISPREAWGVTLYLRALQRSRKGSLADAPAAERRRLEQQRTIAPQPSEDGAAEAEAPAPAAVVIELRDEPPSFSPDEVTITAGETIEWHNTGFLVHTVTLDPQQVAKPEDVRLPEDAATFDSGRLFPDKRFRHTFETPGRYKYFCKPHESTGMIGEVIVEPAGGEQGGG